MEKGSENNEAQIYKRKYCQRLFQSSNSDCNCRSVGISVLKKQLVGFERRYQRRLYLLHFFKQSFLISQVSAV